MVGREQRVLPVWYRVLQSIVTIVSGGCTYTPVLSHSDYVRSRATQVGLGTRLRTFGFADQQGEFPLMDALCFCH